MTKSQKLFERARKTLAGGVNSPVRAFRAVGGYPRFAVKGAGSRVIDVDGRSYVDYCLSWGPLILGHARKEIVSAARKALERGSTFGMPTEGEVELGEELSRSIPSLERVRLTSSGTEAVMSALRLARAFTQREFIVKFAGCYHGHVDSLLVQAGSGATTLGVPDSAGVPAAWARTTITLPYNDLEAVRRTFAKLGNKIAAVIVEPFVGNMGVVLPEPGFLEGLRRLTKKRKALLIFDEVITGFRLCYGGAQDILGIKPDLTTLGKIVGGGFPLAAYGGRREIMELVAPTGPVYQAGTLSGNPVAVAAGLECLRLLRRESVHRELGRAMQILLGGLAAESARHGVPVQINSAGPMFTLFFCETPVRDYASAKKADAARYARFFNALLDGGVYFPPAQFEAAFLSAAHRPQDIDRTISAARRAFARLGHAQKLR